MLRLEELKSGQVHGIPCGPIQGPGSDCQSHTLLTCPGDSGRKLIGSSMFGTGGRGIRGPDGP